MMRICAIMIAAAFSVQPLPQADGPLEPSVQNEVDHAIDLGEKWLERNFKDIGRGTRPACPRSRGTRDPTTASQKHHNPSNVSEPSGFRWMQKRVEHVYSPEGFAICRLHGSML